METIAHHLQILQILISAIAGFVGVGIGIGVFRNTIKQVQAEIVAIKEKQSSLRGENAGGIPMYVSRGACENLRSYCMASSDGRMKTMCEDIATHTLSIRALNNFARWWMQKEGLTIDQINHILNGG